MRTSSRRAVLQAASLCIVGTVATVRPGVAAAEDLALIKQLTGKVAIESARVHLVMPAAFGNGYSVPLSFAVDSPMTEADHVKSVLVLAPGNPIVTVARFQFDAQSGRAAISTRIRLSQPQNVLAVAEMSDGTLLMARTWVKVDTDGCT